MPTLPSGTMTEERIKFGALHWFGSLKPAGPQSPPGAEMSTDAPKFGANNSDVAIFAGLGGANLPNYPKVNGHRNNHQPTIGPPQ